MIHANDYVAMTKLPTKKYIATAASIQREERERERERERKKD